MSQIKKETKQTGATIALIGLPNAGKSALLNRIIGERKAIVADEEHTTRDVNKGTEYWEGYQLNFVDTGGLVPDATDKIHKMVQIKSWSAIASADILVWVIDRKTNPEVFSLKMLQRIWKLNKPLIICINKVDDPNSERSIADYASLGGTEFINVSANSSYGLNELLDTIADKAKELGFKPQEIIVDKDEQRIRGKNRFIKEVIKKGNYFIVRNVNKDGSPATYEMVSKDGEDLMELDDQEINDLEAQMQEDIVPKIVILGKPNVGKSTLLNTLFKEEKQIVSDIAGTTLSVNEYPYQRTVSTQNEEGQWIETIKNYELLDTAGIRKKGSRVTGVETFATFRTIESAYLADLIIFLLDASQPISHQDQVVGGIAKEAHKGLLIVANKVDLLDLDGQKAFQKDLFKKFDFLKQEDVVFVSAKEGINLRGIFNKVDEILARRGSLIPRPELRKLFNYLMKNKKPPKLPAKRKAVCYDLIQTKTNPPTFEFLVKDKDTIHWSYIRFLENTLRRQFKLNDTGIKIKITEIFNKNVEE
jgi:GTPase